MTVAMTVALLGAMVVMVVVVVPPGGVGCVLVSVTGAHLRCLSKGEAV